jgi:hypothetical protein
MTDDLRAALHRGDADPHDPQEFLRAVQQRVRRRRSQRLLPMALAAVVVATIVGAVILTGSSAKTKVPTSERRQVPADLVGSWTVTSPLQPGGAEVILGDVLTVFLPCGLVDGSWLADSSGAFVGDLNSGDEACFNGPQKEQSPPWIAQAARFRADGDRMQLLDAAGSTIATLSPGAHPTVGPNRASFYADEPTLTPALRERLADPAPLPAGLTPVTLTTLTGRWHRERAGDNPRAYLEFGPAIWGGSNGCNGAGGRLLVGDHGSVITTPGISTLVACQSSHITSWAETSRRAGFDGATLVLFDVAGHELGRLTRAA